MTGEQAYSLLARTARLKGVSLLAFAAPLSPNPTTWLKQLREAKRPRPRTLARIMALVEARDVPPAPLNNFQKSPHTQPLFRAEGSAPIENAPEPVDREPCFYCGTRADLAPRYGCRYCK